MNAKRKSKNTLRSRLASLDFSPRVAQYFSLHLAQDQLHWANSTQIVLNLSTTKRMKSKVDVSGIGTKDIKEDEISIRLLPVMLTLLVARGLIFYSTPGIYLETFEE